MMSDRFERRESPVSAEELRLGVKQVFDFE
jgi:hypothetical protein